MPGKYYTEAERNYVIGLHQSGQNATEIAARPEVSMSVHSVRRCIVNFRLNGVNGLKTKDKSGRRRVTTPAEDAAIVQAVEERPLHPALSSVRNALPRLDAKKSTTYRRLKAAGVSACTPARKPNLTAAHRQARLQFADDYVDMPAAFWDEVLGTDETTLGPDRNGTVSVWRRPGPRLEPNKVYNVDILENSHVETENSTQEIECSLVEERTEKHGDISQRRREARQQAEIRRAQERSTGRRRRELLVEELRVVEARRTQRTRRAEDKRQRKPLRQWKRHKAAMRRVEPSRERRERGQCLVRFLCKRPNFICPECPVCPHFRWSITYGKKWKRQPHP